MDRVHSLFDRFGLHAAAATGDDEGVQRAIDLGADVNGLDHAGRTVIMCAVAGQHWENINASDASFMTPKRLNTIRILLRHPEISLFVLNAPQSSMNGVTPLGMAAWLNMVEVVQLLLEDSADTVSVDGMDSHGATALMYAARDGSLEVVQVLLSHGARPDFRDCNHRTSIQFALVHPQILWLCESILRRHRWRECQFEDRIRLHSGSEGLIDLANSSLPFDSLEPPSLFIFTNDALERLTDTLISCIASADLSFIHSLLFAPPLPSSSCAARYPMSAPVLVNRPDSKGWSPIHYCANAEHPCIQMLDALYCAGADVALFTENEHYTLLHILARSVRSLSEHPDDALSLYQFTVHLICDLRAPLSARDRNDETCIHIAAEHGSCIDLLMTFLDCDSTGRIRELRNSRGLTALEVARPEFRVAFGKDTEGVRPASSISILTVRPKDSFISLASFSECRSNAALADDTSSLSFPLDFNIEESSHELLSTLRMTSPSIHHPNDSAHLDRIEFLVAKISQISRAIFRHFRTHIEEATKELQDLRINAEKINTLLYVIDQAANDKLLDRGKNALHFAKWNNRDSEDSQITAVGSSKATSQTEVNFIGDISVATQTNSSNLSTKSGCLKHSRSWADWFDVLAVGFHQPSHHNHLVNLVKQEPSSFQETPVPASTEETGYSGMAAKLNQITKKQRLIEEKSPEPDRTVEKKNVTQGAAKFKTWIKRFIATPDRTVGLEIVKEIDEDGCAVGREVKTLHIPCQVDGIFDVSIDAALRTSRRVLDASKRDLLVIEQCIASAEQFIVLANRAIARGERVVKRAVKQREVIIAHLQISASSTESSDNGILIRRNIPTPGALRHFKSLNLRPSIASLSSTYSTASSRASLAPTLAGNDDEDTRTIRRLILRKIEANVVGSWDKMDKVTVWLRIVKEVVRGMKRRAYL